METKLAIAMLIGLALTVGIAIFVKYLINL
jgi:hypothetical protein